MAHLRVLTWAAHATQRTPVLPLMECHQPGSRWVDEHIDVRTGLPTVRRGSVEGAANSPPRPCGWALHSVGNEDLPAPLCMQRPHEGCFHAFATPDELAPHLPAGYWNGSCSVEAPPIAPLGARARVPRCQPLPPVLRWWDERHSQAGGDTPSSAASSPHPELDHLYALLAPFMATTHRRPRPRGRVGRSQSAAQLDSDGLVELALGRTGRGLQPTPVSALSAPPLPVLLLQAVPLDAISQVSIVSKLATFDRELRRINGGTLQPQGAAPGLGTAWIRCLSMVRRNKCTAVC